MEKKLRILIVEDLPSDAELAKRALATEFKNFISQVVENEEEYKHALKTFKPDLIVSDYQMPVFDGLSALKIRQEKYPDIPFIVLTGSMNEDTAVECMKAGADDYVIKERIKRLGQSALKAIEKKKIEIARKQSEELLAFSQNYLNRLTHSISDAIISVKLPERLIEWANDSVKHLGYQTSECVGRTTDFLYVNNDSFMEFGAELEQMIKADKDILHTEYLLKRKNGETFPADITVTLIKEKGVVINATSIIRDITEHKLATQIIKNRAQELEKQVNKSEVQRIATLSVMSDLNEATNELTNEIDERKLAEKSLEQSEKRIRELSNYMDEKHEEEKKEIGKEIHDGLGQLLTGIKMDLKWIEKKWPEGSAVLKNKFASMNNIIDIGVKEVQKLSFQLRPKMLDELGIIETLKAETANFKDRSGIDCSILFNPKEFTVERHRSSTIYRVMMELLTNIYRHAKANKVDIKLEIKEKKYIFTVIDNGKGITQEQIDNKSSFGLLSITERIKVWNGSLNISGKANKGTIVSVTIPM